VPRLTLVIERLSKSGDGVSHHQGRAVFVSGALPGERVVAEVTPDGKTLQGTLLEVLDKSPARRAPACPLADRCGGCDWLHADEALQVAEKEEIVASALEHVGKLARDRYHRLPTVRSPQAMGYRRRATLHPAGGKLSFFGRGSHDRVAVDRCPALTPPLEALPGALTQALAPLLKDVDEVHLLESNGAVAVSLHLKVQARDKHRQAAQALVRGAVRGVVLVPTEGKGVPEEVGEPVLEERGVALRPDGFAQANAQVNEALVTAAVEALQLTRADAVLELYSGNGNFTFDLAARCARVVAVESGPVSVSLAQRMARERSIGNVRFLQGDAEKITKGLLAEGAHFERLLLDPPRTGAKGLGRLAAKLEVARVVYVACDPAALARDAAELVSNGFVPETVQLFDLFPQTRHIEAVMAFALRGAR
jgi:23S rRNA (uracil1939-C5)-methyltransferase